MARGKAKRVGTLQDLVDQRRYLYLVCQTTGCPAAAVDVDLEATIAKFGNVTLQEFAERSRCRICKAYEPRTICPPLNTAPARKP